MSKITRMPVKKLLSLLVLSLYTLGVLAQPASGGVPAVYSNIQPAEGGAYQLSMQGDLSLVEVNIPERYTLEQAIGDPVGTAQGIAFTFPEKLSGTLYYGFIPYGDSRHPLPVYFRATARIEAGKAEVPIRGNLAGRYDMIGWEESGSGTLGYRIVDSLGQYIYDGIINFGVDLPDGAFSVAPTIIEGPFVNQVGPEGAVLSYTVNEEKRTRALVGGKAYRSNGNGRVQEVVIDGLEPDSPYTYTIMMQDDTLAQYSFRTAPRPGSRKSFTFAYASDSRSGQGGGERDLLGTNYYIMKKILALSTREQAAFLQFSGDLIDGYLTSQQETDLQYANWKRAVQPWWHYLPIYVGMGNHEALVRLFLETQSGAQVSVDRWPFDSQSAEATFAANFAMPENGPESEDGAAYDPNPGTMDFPSYDETVFYYTYDNVAIIVLNSDYFYSPSVNSVRVTSGNIHGYILDQQLAWMKETITTLESDADIDHIFLTLHTPFFPNGGHVADDMWYNGQNGYRPYIAGKALTKGIIERRDELLDILVNQSQKVRAILTGDEHNYNRLPVGPQTPIYPEPYFFPKVELSRTIWQINNGAAGAPYYAQEETPWSGLVESFTTQHALVLFRVDGERINVEVLNPDTLEVVDTFSLN